MSKVKWVIAVAAVAYLAVAMIGIGGLFSQATARDSQPLIIRDQTVGGVSVAKDGANLVVDVSTDQDFPLYLSNITFIHNAGGIAHAMSGRTSDPMGEYVVSRSANHHRYKIPLSLIKGDNVSFQVAADILLSGTLLRPKAKFFAVAKFAVAQEVTTTTKPKVTTTTKPEVTTTTKPEVTTTTKPAVTTTVAKEKAEVTTTTKPEVTTTTKPEVTTTVAAVTVTTVRQVTATTVRIVREQLPITGASHNWYLIGALIALTGAGLYLGSLKRSS